MAQPYLDELKALMDEWGQAMPSGVHVECKHFFSGAALYANGKIAACLTPAGLALKLPEPVCSELLRTRRAKPLRYFSKSPVKKGWALLSEATASNAVEVLQLLVTGIQSGLGEP